MAINFEKIEAYFQQQKIASMLQNIVKCKGIKQDEVIKFWVLNYIESMGKIARRYSEDTASGDPTFLKHDEVDRIQASKHEYVAYAKYKGWM